MSIKTLSRLACIVVMVSLFVAGCGGIELYQNLSEEDANEILVLLSDNGIKATKKKELKQNETFYAIEVSQKDMSRARSLLLQHNLPRRKELGLTGVYKEKGLIPTPDEQKARYMLALKGEIINSLRKIPNVIDADVVLNVPTRDEFATAEEQHRQRPTASAVVRVNPDSTGASSMTEAKIQQFVANSVEGMNPRDVAVVISYLPVGGYSPAGDVKSVGKSTSGAPGMAAAGPPPAVEHKLIGLALDAESKDKLKIYVLIFFIVLIILSVALIVVIVQGARMRRTLAALQGPAGEHPAIEGQLMDEAPHQLEEPPEDEF